MSAARVLARCDALAACSEDRRQLTRVSFSPESLAAGELVMGWMRAAGMSARLDAMGNVRGRYEALVPNARTLLLGSHLDTVRNAGRYDGILGVVLAIEVVQRLSDGAIRLPFALEIAGFCDEEGVRFGTTLLGSRAVAGTLDAGTMGRKDASGMTLREAMRDFGLDPKFVADAAICAHDVLAYAEVHIEQGPVLEVADLPVGVVTAINGFSRLLVTLMGCSGHAGTVPMGLRRDAMAAAAECVLAIERLARARSSLVATVGRLECRPGAVNVIPGEAEFTIDVRSPHDEEREAVVSDILSKIKAICDGRSLEARIAVLQEEAAVACAPWLSAQLSQAIEADGVTVLPLSSGAGHDAMALSAVCDVGMLFLRCRNGISHHPAESVSLADVDVAARVLERFVRAFVPRSP